MAKRAKTPEEVLAKYWGYPSFRPLQREIIDSIVAGIDTLALMPTGGGKSITYQVPAMLMDGICIVITPLISLMVDQINRLRSQKIPALALHSGMTAREIDLTLDNAVYGNYKFLYLSPERVATKLFIERMRRMNVSMIAVDEAHCISQWGYDFRPSYLRIAELREHAPDATILAVTATATEEVAEDIMTRMLFTGRNIKRMSFARDNLSYIVRSTEDKDEHLIRVLSSLKGSGIVYCRKRKECERVAEMLKERGESADFYHGGMDYHLRKAKQSEWIGDKTRVVVATNAFGMGIDKSAVRFVAHYDIPESIEAYYQEAGRAGRDGEEAFAVLLTNNIDQRQNEQRIESSFPSIEEIHHIYNMICNYLSLANGEGKGVPFDFNIYDFSMKFSLYSGKVRSAIKILELNGYITLTDELDNPARIMFVISREELYKITLVRTNLENFIKLLLRIYPGLFSNYVAINIEYIAALSGYTPDYIRESLKSIMHLRIINYIPARRTPLLIFHEERLPKENLHISPESYSFRLDRAKMRYKSMDNFANNRECRALQIRQYFGEECCDTCGKCDICRSKKSKGGYAYYRGEIEHTLSQGELDIKELIKHIKGDSDNIIAAIKEMISQGELIQNSDNTLSLPGDIKRVVRL